MLSKVVFLTLWIVFNVLCNGGPSKKAAARPPANVLSGVLHLRTGFPAPEAEASSEASNHFHGGAVSHRGPFRREAPTSPKRALVRFAADEVNVSCRPQRRGDLSSSCTAPGKPLSAYEELPPRIAEEKANERGTDQGRHVVE